MEHRISRMPLLGENDCTTASIHVWPQHLFEDKGRQRSHEIVPFPVLAVVNAAWMKSTDPLAPAVKIQGTSLLVPWCIRIADKPEVGFEARVGEGSGKPGDSR
jgi:hypothetical protein